MTTSYSFPNNWMVPINAETVVQERGKTTQHKTNNLLFQNKLNGLKMNKKRVWEGRVHTETGSW